MMDIPVENFDPKPKRKNNEKRRGYFRRPGLFLIASIALITIAVFFIARPRFLLMTDAPKDQLLYRMGPPDFTTYQADFQTGEMSVLPGDVKQNDRFSRSPDGTLVAMWGVTEAEDDKFRLVLIEFESQTEWRSFGTFYTTLAHPISWSPDGQWIAFAAYSDPSQEINTETETEIWMLHIQTGELKRLTTSTYSDVAPSFSPDGTQIVYLSAPDGYHRVYIMDLATGESRLITPDHDGRKPRWSPDGQWIAFESHYRKPNQRLVQSLDVYIVRPSTLYIQPVTNTPNQDEYLVGWE